MYYLIYDSINNEYCYFNFEKSLQTEYWSTTPPMDPRFTYNNQWRSLEAYIQRIVVKEGGTREVIAQGVTIQAIIENYPELFI